MSFTSVYKIPKSRNTRFRIQAGDCNVPGVGESNPTLKLEALVLEEGSHLDSLAMEVRNTLASGAVKTFLLAEFPAQWHMPSPRTSLLTTPGITEADGDYPCPSDATIRYHLQRIFHQSRHG